MKLLDEFARKRFDRRVLHLAVRWVLDQGAEIALWGGRKPEQLDPVPEISGWRLDQAALAAIDQILAETIKDPVGPEFMAPPPARRRRNNEVCTRLQPVRQTGACPLNY